MEERMPPVHPGEILLEEFMRPLGLDVVRLAGLTGIAEARLQTLVAGQCGLDWETAIRLAACFGTSPEFWLHAQTGYELEQASYSGVRRRIEGEVQAVAPERLGAQFIQGESHAG